jgi:hypothetical protein
MSKRLALGLLCSVFSNQERLLLTSASLKEMAGVLCDASSPFEKGYGYNLYSSQLRDDEPGGTDRGLNR